MANHIQHNRLEVPAAVPSDHSAFEVLRIWNAEAKYQVSLRPDIEPFAWGIILADAARSIAESETSSTSPFFFKRLLEGFHAEIEHPTK
jgi:hypothetical protein